MSSSMNRRDLLAAGSALFLGMGLGSKALSQSKGETKKVLFFIKSAGFPHPVVTRKNGKPSLAETILIKAGKEHGFEVVASKDGGDFEPDKIGQWDAFVFETTGDLTTEGTSEHSPPITLEGEKALYDAIRGGKGFLGMHCAADTFGHHGKRNKGKEDPYIDMLGGEFIVHGAQQKSRIKIVSPKFPGVDPSWGGSENAFELQEEWYALKNFADNLHVIMVQETEGMKGPMYNRPDYPMTWARSYGKGRVFYTSMGHREDVWENPMYQGLLMGALAWATGKVDADIEPNIHQVTPHCNELKRS